MQYVLFNPQAGNGSGAQQARALDARFPEETFSYTDMTTISDYAAWLGTLPERERRLFVRRYWYGEALDALAAEEGQKPARLAQLMLKLRKSLRAYLEAEGAEI